MSLPDNAMNACRVGHGVVFQVITGGRSTPDRGATTRPSADSTRSRLAVVISRLPDNQRESVTRCTPDARARSAIVMARADMADWIVDRSIKPQTPDFRPAWGTPPPEGDDGVGVTLFRAAQAPKFRRQDQHPRP